jgi:SSS family transporter
MTHTLFFVLLYLMLQLALGVWISRGITTESDYLIAGRRLGYTLATFSIFATWFGAETVIGSAGNAYANGVSLGNAEPFGYGLCLILMGLVFAVPLWRRRLTTLADLFRIRYSVGVERVAAIILVPSSILWAAAQVRAFGQIISSASAGWNVEYAIGVAAAFTILYTMFGGLLVDAVTDVIQGAILIVGLLILLVAVTINFGGLDAVVAHVTASGAVSALPVQRGPWLAIAEEWAIPIFGSVIATELVTRVIATRSAAVARRTPVIAGVFYLAIGLIPLTAGLLGSALGFQVADPEQIIPVLARELLPTILYAAFAGAIISAILSTVDSTLLTASGLLSHNLIVPLAHVEKERTKVLIARGGVLTAGLIAYALALTAEGVFELVEQASALGSAGSLVAVCFGLFTRFGGPPAALAALLSGLATYVGGAAFSWSYPFLASLAVSLAAYVMVGAVETLSHA